MDRFLEEVVTKHKRGLDEVLYYMSWIVMIFCAVIGFAFLQSLPYGFNVATVIITIIPIAIAIYLWIIHDRFRTEYEYTFTNGSLDFAMVFNNKKRKSLGSLNVAKVDAFGKVNSGSFRRHTSANNVKHLRWFLNRDSELYYIAFSKESQKSVIIFEPSEEMVSYIKHYLPYGAHQEN